jgi:hypothetical protein
MNRYVLTGIIILVIILGFCILVPVSIKQNTAPEIPKKDWSFNKSAFTWVEPVVASFGLDENNPDRTVFLNDPERMKRFIHASEVDIIPHYYPNGLVLYYGNMNGTVLVIMDPDEPVNRTVINEIYRNISAWGRRFNITNVPIKFIQIEVVRTEVQPNLATVNITGVSTMTPDIPDTITTNTPPGIPGQVSGLVIIMNKTELKLNSTLEFFIKNNGSITMEFSEGYPFTIESRGNGTWTHIAGRSGTQAFWSLEGGETSRKMIWNTARVREYQKEGIIDRIVVNETGTFRVCIHAFAGGYSLKNEVRNCREFTVVR